MLNWKISKHKNPIDNWPKDGNGELVPPVYLTHVHGGPVDTELTINLLEAYSIPVVTKYPNNGEFGKVILGFSASGIDLYVPEIMLEDAQNILNADAYEEVDDENIHE